MWRLPLGNAPGICPWAAPRGGYSSVHRSEGTAVERRRSSPATRDRWVLGGDLQTDTGSGQLAVVRQLRLGSDPGKHLSSQLD